MECYLGQIQLFSFPFAPAGWIECAGQILNINQNQALYALIGAMYGGDGRTTFAVPDLRNAAPSPYTKYYIAMEGIFPSRN